MLSTVGEHDLRFGSWLWHIFQSKQKLLGLSVVAVPLSLAVPYITNLAAAQPEEWILGIHIGVQLTILLMLIFVSPYMITPAEGPRLWTNERKIQELCGYQAGDEWSRAKAAMLTSEAQLRNAWLCLLVSWAMLYFVLLASTCADIAVKIPRDPGQGSDYDSLIAVRPLLLYVFKPGSPLLAVAENFWNNASSLCIFLCYSVLARHTVFTPETHHRQAGLPWAAGVGLIVTVTGAELIFCVLALPYTGVFQAISGLAGACAMAMLVGRFDSKYIDPPVPLLFLLYLYASIQPMFFLLDSTYQWECVIMDAALVLKFILFMFICWLYQSNKIAFYLLNIRNLDHYIDGRWKAFHRVRVLPRRDAGPDLSVYVDRGGVDGAGG